MAKFLGLVAEAELQLAQVLDVHAVFASAPVLRVCDSYFQFAQA
ncbi:hypothetical protein [Synechococcus sp. KORDI-52]|nr:hypothetical protein [Synechococcus sp. KORDI-52]